MCVSCVLRACHWAKGVTLQWCVLVIPSLSPPASKFTRRRNGMFLLSQPDGTERSLTRDITHIANPPPHSPKQPLRLAGGKRLLQSWQVLHGGPAFCSALGKRAAHLHNSAKKPQNPIAPHHQQIPPGRELLFPPGMGTTGHNFKEKRGPFGTERKKTHHCYS